MPQASSVLCIDDKKSLQLDRLTELGAVRVNGFTEARSFLKSQSPAVIVLPFMQTKSYTDFIESLPTLAPHAQWILTGSLPPPTQTLKWWNDGFLFACLEENDLCDLEDRVREALHFAGEQQQRESLRRLFAEQTQQLQRLVHDVDERVAKRHKLLRKSQKNLNDTRLRLDAFHKALIAMHRAASLSEIESSLNEILSPVLNLDWARIRSKEQSSPLPVDLLHVLTLDLPHWTGPKRQNQVQFRKASGPFTVAETDFLTEVSEALGLAVERLQQLNEAETLKAQWQATFDSIPHPLCLVSTKFEILKLNRSFLSSIPGASFRTLLGQNCFYAFFGSESQHLTKLEPPFQIRQTRAANKTIEVFEVTSENLGLTHDLQPVQLILFRPITEQVRLERQILEASKSAELGTIGSSIAHELNNPLGGMLSFLQLILLDLEPSTSMFKDVKSMEQATLRCRDIILNLLSFARKQEIGEMTEVDLAQVIERAVKLIELQTHSRGVAIQIDASAKQSFPITANGQAISQAICNVLQNSFEAIDEKQSQQPAFTGLIELSSEWNEVEYRLSITDNGLGISPENQSKIFNPLFSTKNPDMHKGMGLTATYRLIQEHGGRLEILSQTGSGTTAIISLPRPKN